MVGQNEKKIDDLFTCFIDQNKFFYWTDGNFWVHLNHFVCVVFVCAPFIRWIWLGESFIEFSCASCHCFKFWLDNGFLCLLCDWREFNYFSFGFATLNGKLHYVHVFCHALRTRRYYGHWPLRTKFRSPAK